MVTVEYPTEKPQYGRVEGTRAAPFGLWMLAILLLPLIGLYMVITGVIQGRRDHQLLQVGQLAKAKLVNKEATKVEINDQPVYKLTFEFLDQNNQTFQKVLKSHVIDKLTDDSYERLLYNPKDPAKSTLVDDLAGSPKLDDNGNITSLNPVWAIAAIVLPGICVASQTLFSLF